MKDAETDAETVAAWAAREPQRGFIECADKLQDRGHSIDALADAMMTIALTMQSKLHGPRAVAARLLALADKFTNEADKLDREARDAASH
jgi:hypothetical protein